MEEIIRLTPPLNDEVVAGLKSGDRVLISGTIYTGRDAAHKRLVDLLDRGEPLPIPIKGEIIFFVGPTPPPPGRAIGAAGPTTSYRMDPYSPRLLAEGLKGMIGKGARSQEVRDAIVKYRGIYFAAVGGAGALLSQRIKKAEIVAYEDLGPEAIRRIEVEDFPVVVVNDIHGNDLFEQGVAAYRR
ncbi:MAG: Fe-S-containing hydro-lyase [Deltaproteobacteria bacterium]|nr:Fe-S-containing hydro-lyase [Deltaproteobacteria bacterium]